MKGKLSDVAFFCHYLLQIHFEPPHGLVVGLVESVLKRHRLLLALPQVSQPHGASEGVGVREASENMNAFLRQHLRGRTKINS